MEFPNNPYAEENFEFFDQRLLDAVQNNEPLVHDFFKILALCHTVMPEVKGKQDINHYSQDTYTCVYQTYCICESVSTWMIMILIFNAKNNNSIDLLCCYLTYPLQQYFNNIFKPLLTHYLGVAKCRKLAGFLKIYNYAIRDRISTFSHVFDYHSEGNLFMSSCIIHSHYMSLHLCLLQTVCWSTRPSLLMRGH